MNRFKQAWKDTNNYADDDATDETRPERGEFGTRSFPSYINRLVAHPIGKVIASGAVMSSNPGLGAALVGTAALQKGVRVAKRYKYLKRQADQDAEWAKHRDEIEQYNAQRSSRGKRSYGPKGRKN